MTVLSANFGLFAESTNHKNVSDSLFIGRLHGMDSPHIISIISNRGTGLTALIVFYENSLDDFIGEDRYKAFENDIAKKLKVFTEWLSLQDSIEFSNFSNIGLRVNAFFEFWIDQDQLDLHLPSDFLFECGRLGLGITMSSNE